MQDIHFYVCYSSAASSSSSCALQHTPPLEMFSANQLFPYKVMNPEPQPQHLATNSVLQLFFTRKTAICLKIIKICCKNCKNQQSLKLCNCQPLV